MSEKEPMQKTRTGYEIPVPKRGEVDRVLERAAKPVVEKKPKRSRRKSKDA